MGHVLMDLLGSSVRVAVPLIFAALGGILSERSGVVNIALEGVMLVAAFASAAASLWSDSAWTGLLFGALAGMGFSLIYAGAVIGLRANQIVAGTAMNLLAGGLVPLLCKLLYGTTGGTPGVPVEARFVTAPIWLAWAAVALVWLWMRVTPWGLWTSFAGEHPEALDAAGVRVNRIRTAALALSGCLAGLGGASLSIFLSSSFSRGMTAGRGFIAIAALIFGKWRPFPAAFACLFFGLTDALQMRLQGVPIWGGKSIPVQFVQILPYIVTIFVLAGAMGQARAPRALGIPHGQSH